MGEASANPVFEGRHFVPVRAALWPPFGRTNRYVAGALATLRGLRPDLVEVHNRANLAARIARAMPRTRISLFVHNDPVGIRGAKSADERAALLRRVRVVCVSQYLTGRFMQGVPEGGQIPSVLHNALDLALLPPGLPQERRERMILFVGRVVADKGADAFVHACGAVLPGLPGWSACMIGSDRFWPNAATTPFQRALAPAAREAGIRMLGYLPHPQVLEAMARAAIVVVPSRWPEPFGLVALEAMASGAALICSDRGGLPEVAGEAALYADPDALAPVLLRLARDGALRARLVEAGLARAQLFDASAARARLIALRATAE